MAMRTADQSVVGDKECKEAADPQLLKEASIEYLPPVSERIQYDSPSENELVSKLCDEFEDSKTENPSLLEHLARCFLRFRYHAYERAKTRMGKYLKWRRKVYGDLSEHSLEEDDTLRAQIESGCFCISPKRLPTGETLFFIKMNQCDPSRFTAEDTVKCWHFLALAAMKEDPCLAEKGFVLVNDMTNTALANLDSRFPLLMANAVNEAMPIRLSHMILINPPFLVRFIIPIVKSVLSAKLSDRINVVFDLDSIFSLLSCSADDLPEQMGGSVQMDGHIAVKQFVLQRITI